MEDKLKNAKEEMRTALEQSAAKKAEAIEAEKVFLIKISKIKDVISHLAIDLKPVFEEKGKGLEVITPVKDSNLIEILYYPESLSKQTRGVNTAALRIEFQPKVGTAKVFRRDSFFVPFAEVETVNIKDESSINHLAEATYEFAKEVAAK